MTCACESVHKFPCQFPPETEPFPFDGKQWCRFHLPLQDAAGNLSAKGRRDNGWEEGGAERGRFAVEIHAHLRAATPWDGDLKNDTRADFKGVTFPDGFDFTRIADMLHVDFEGATFGNWTNFEATTFGGRSNFEAATFGEYASFTGATFGNWTNFRGATFGGWANFEAAIFGDWAKFEGATFNGRARFQGATFGGSANFEGAKFGGTASFSKVNFRGHTEISTEKELDATPTFQRLRFSNAIFIDACKFENCVFVTSADFNGAAFHDLVAFHGCEFHPGMSFHQTKFLKTKEDKLNTKKENDDATERLERSYRTLKLEMEKLRARNEEADFFALEMECRRQRGSVPPFERFAATLYKHLSDYGRSVDLPLIWLLVLAYAAHYLYLGVAMIGCNPGPGARLAFTLEQMFRPFFVWDKGAPGTGNCLVENFPLLIPFLASLQSLGTIGLLTLFLLALRRRFKMD